ncbi:phospholipase D family protein [Marinovum sp. 1_MG-2023]
MPKFLDGPELRRDLRKAFKRESAARLAVAYWGDGAAKDLGLSGEAVRITCNLMGGGTNPEEVRRLIKTGVQVRHHVGLHVKLGVVGDVSFLGSSNMSANGLGAEGAKDGWAEANILYQSERAEIASMFERLWGESREVTDDDLALAQRRWNLRSEAAKEADKIVLHPEPLVKALRARPEDFENSFFAVFDELTDPEEIEVVDLGDAEAQRRHGPLCEVYWDWSDGTLPDEGYIVDFRTPPTGARALALFVRKTSCPDFDIGNERFHPAIKITEFAGADIGSKDDRQRLRDAMTAYLVDNPLDDDRARCGKLLDLAEYLE